MYRLVTALVLLTIVHGAKEKVFRLCTSSEEAFDECTELTNDSQFSQLDCYEKQDSNSCIRSVQSKSLDFFLATSHDYLPARRSYLKPIAFERLDNSSLIIIVAPKDITREEIEKATVDYDHSDHRTTHAALLFNEKRGRNMCGNIRKRSTPKVRIEDSSDNTVTESEVLICPDLSVSNYSNYVACNFEAEIQRAFFVHQDASEDDVVSIREIIDAIIERYVLMSRSSEDLPDNADVDINLIFRENAIAFDPEPTYVNGVDETVFNTLHCDSAHQPHPHVNHHEHPDYPRK